MSQVVEEAWRRANNSRPAAVATEIPTLVKPSVMIMAFSYVPKSQRYDIKEEPDRIWYIAVYEDLGLIWLGRGVGVPGIPAPIGILDKSCADRLAAMVRGEALGRAAAGEEPASE